MSAHDKLREAIGMARRAIQRGEPMTFTPSEMRALADAAESTLPKTKMVEVWRVEFCVVNGDRAPGAPHWRPGAWTFFSEREAKSQADNCGPGFRCVRLMPHQQEVPA